MIQIDKLIKKEQLKRFNRFKDENTRRDSLYRYISVSSWVDATVGLHGQLEIYALR